jgi:hypothetical protein
MAEGERSFVEKSEAMAIEKRHLNYADILKSYEFYSPGEILDAVAERKGELTLLAGSASIGKTTLILSGIQERPAYSIFIQPGNFEREVNVKDTEKEYGTNVDSARFKIDESGSFCIENFWQQLKIFKKENGLDLVVVDEVSIGRNASFLKQLKAMSIELDTAIMWIYRIPGSESLLIKRDFGIERLGMSRSGLKITDNILCITSPKLTGIDEDLNGFSIKNSSQVFGIKGALQDTSIYLDFDRKRRVLRKAMPEKVVKRTIRKNQIMAWTLQS